MICKEIRFSGHALLQMFKRNIETIDVRECILNGEVIADYPSDKPYPSKLLLSKKSKPLHVVVAQDVENSICIVVTAYFPDLQIWNYDFKTKK
ncbi:MAG: DUF4258 domain-containing protein [Bacteroidota bacterium]|nr:DUF4258 domain-containing protein [Bacteroidota bacterium]